MAAPFNLVSAADAYSGTDYRTLYTVPAGKQAFIKSVIASNGSRSNGVTLQMMDGGVTPIDLAKPTLAANASSNILAGTLTLSAGESLRQKSTDNNLRFDDLVYTSTGTAYYGATATDIIYANGVYVAIGFRSGTDPANNFLVSSTNGTTWTWRDVDTVSGNAIALTSIAYGAGLFVVVGYTTSATSFIATSPDGVTWTPRTPAAGMTYSNHVIYGGGRFVAVGGTTTTSSIQTSTDGITWTARTGAVADITSNAAAVAYDPTSGLYAMTTGATGVDGIQTSPDGVTWTKRNSNSAPYATIGIAAKAGVFFARKTHPNSSCISTDGVNWVTVAAPLGAPDRVTQTKFLNGLFVCTSANYINTSPDGMVWTSQPYSSPTSLYHPKVAHDGTNWFVANENYGDIYRRSSLDPSTSQSANFVASVVEVAA